MKPTVCHLGTLRTVYYTAVMVLVAASAAMAQVRIPVWHKVGSMAVDLNLASPATGPMQQVWFSADGSTLYARTPGLKTFATTDFDTWTPVANPPDPPAPGTTAQMVRLPEAGAQIVPASPNSNQAFALGRNLSRTDDGGHSWMNLTAFKSQSVVGFGQRSVAVHPLDPDQVVVANDYGVWRSMDGGLSWTGLNLYLPNLSVRRILSTPSGTAGVRVVAGVADSAIPIELAPSGTVWEPVSGLHADEDALSRKYSQLLGVEITAVSTTGDTVIAGSSDGRIWWSQDGGKTPMNLSTLPPGMEVKAGNRIERLWVDPSQSLVAIAALSGSGHHLLRTSNRGLTWEAVDTASLPDGPAWSVVGDRSAGAIYVATDKGVFYGHTDLDLGVTTSIVWQHLTPPPMPQVRATDVRLDPSGVQLYIALDGYGVYRTPAPHRADTLRIVNAADYSNRAAAPGSLLSVIGTPVNSVRGDNLDYPVLLVLDNASQIQVPFEAVGPNVVLTLQTPSGTQFRGLAVQSVSPAILTGSDGVPVVADADSGLAIDGRNPAHSNGRIQIMAAGLGKVRPEWPAGVAAPAVNPPAVVANVQAYLDGKPLQVTAATLAPQFIGFYIVEIQLPPVTNAGPAELHITADGQESNRVQIVIEP
jgi:uncharacterized protein (TIGR03437 family)